MKHMISNKAKCPHYKHEDSQMIYCDGITEGSVIHVAFANKTEALDFKKTYCRGNYTRCNICKMLSEDI